LKKGEIKGLMLRLAFNTLRKDGFFPLVLSRIQARLKSGKWAAKTF